MLLTFYNLQGLKWDYSVPQSPHGEYLFKQVIKNWAKLQGGLFLLFIIVLISSVLCASGEDESSFLSKVMCIFLYSVMMERVLIHVSNIL
jgi:hypothetical protein